jgi:hypothetical protein
MTEEPAEGTAEAEEALEERRALIASVEELRALLAPLTDDDRVRVLELARQLAHPAERS